ncbi:hypothetical protein Tco_0550524 [Tanacetum coccineum]
MTLNAGNKEQPDEGMCRVDKFEVIKYSVGDNEEFLAFAHLNATVGIKFITDYQYYLDSSQKRTRVDVTPPQVGATRRKRIAKVSNVHERLLKFIQDLAENRIDLMIYSEKCHVLNSHGHSEALINTLFAQTLKMENHPEQTIKGVSSF